MSLFPGAQVSVVPSFSSTSISYFPIEVGITFNESRVMFHDMFEPVSTLQSFH